MISVENLVITAGSRTVLGHDGGLSLQVPTGSVCGIIGPNGSGKSTLLRAMFRSLPAGLEVASGRVSLDGVDVLSMSRKRLASRVTFVGQHASTAGDKAAAGRVADEVALGLIGAGPQRSDSQASTPDQRILDSLESVGLVHKADHALSSLSGGELQRVSLARAVVRGGGHALLDEPTNHLDIRHRLEALVLLPKIAPTVVVVLHDLELAARFCDALVLLDAGRVVANGAPAQVLTEESLGRAYQVQARRLAHGASPLFEFHLPGPRPSERTEQ